MARKVYLGIGGKSRAVKKMYVAPKPLNNLISDGMMEPGNWSGGTQDTAHVAFGSYSMRMDGQSGSPEALLTSAQSIALSSSHIYYAAVHAYQTTLQGSVDIYWPIAEPAFMIGKALPAANQWCRISGRNGRASFSGSHPIRFDYNNGNAVGTMWFDGPMLIDLTAEFGAGSEPDLAWCDKYIKLGSGGNTYVEPNADIAANSTARLVKKGYIGIGGVARPFWSRDSIEYYGQLEELSTTSMQLAATTCFENEEPRYAFFGGGRQYLNPGGSSSTTSPVTNVAVYNKNLVKSDAPSLSQARYNLSAAPVGNYVIFAGGYTGSATSYETDAYNYNATKTSVGNLSQTKSNVGGGCVPSPLQENGSSKYAIFVGGWATYNETLRNSGNAFSTSLARSTITGLSVSKANIGTANTPSYILFAGGESSDTSGYKMVESYNQNLSKTTANDLPIGRSKLCGASTKNYAIFVGGGSSLGSGIYRSAYAYSNNLTRTTVDSLSHYSEYGAGTTLNGCAIFAGGDTGSLSNVGSDGEYASSKIDIYDDNLTHKVCTFRLSQGREYLAGTSIQNYALFGGGATRSGNSASTVNSQRTVEALIYIPPDGGTGDNTGDGGGSGDIDPVG